MPGLVSYGEHLVGIRREASLEHGHLQAWPVGLVDEKLVSGNRLDDVVEVAGHSACVRPQAVVDLFCVHKLAGHPRCPLQERPELQSLGGREISYGGYVAFRFNDERSETQRADAVFNEPGFRLVDHAAWQRLPSSSEVTS
jgi:hypothetical protein